MPPASLLGDAGGEEEGGDKEAGVEESKGGDAEPPADAPCMCTIRVALSFEEKGCGVCPLLFLSVAHAHALSWTGVGTGC